MCWRSRLVKVDQSASTFNGAVIYFISLHVKGFNELSAWLITKRHVTKLLLRNSRSVFGSNQVFFFFITKITSILCLNADLFYNLCGYKNLQNHTKVG